jgi:hypothetical protein
VSRQFAWIAALVLSSLAASIARAQATPVTVTILRRTPVRTAPSNVSNTIAFLNPSTFEVTQIRVDGAFIRLLLRQIDRRNPATGYGYIAAVDVAVDSATTAPVTVQTDTQPRARPATVAPSRPDTAVVKRSEPPPSAAPARPSTDSAPPLARYLVGFWTCQGGSPSGRKLASEVRFATQLGNRWLQSSHLDVPPGPYSSLALWPIAPADSAPSATVVYDNFGGARRFLLNGWTADSVVLVRDTTERGARLEQFTYRRVAPDAYWYAWHVRRDASGPMVLGDSATCTRRAATP